MGLAPPASPRPGKESAPSFAPPSFFLFPRGAKPRAVPLAGGKISTPSFSLPSLAPTSAQWPNFRGISKVLGKLYLGFLALDFPSLLLCCLFAFLRVMFQAQPCAFLKV